MANCRQCGINNVCCPSKLCSNCLASNTLIKKNLKSSEEKFKIEVSKNEQRTEVIITGFLNGEKINFIYNLTGYNIKGNSGTPFDASFLLPGDYELTAIIGAFSYKKQVTI